MAEKEDDKAELQELNDKEQIFADTYLVTLNKNESSLASGSPPTSARQQGYEMYNRPHVKAYIEAKLKERTITAEETIKLISDTAQASVTDYFKPVMIERVPKIKIGLSEYIARKEEYVSQEMEFLDQSGYTEQVYDDFVERLKKVKDEILRLQIELNRNPAAYRIIDGEPELIEEMQLDINALVLDKERGRVKKVKTLKDGGIEVEMYSADDAQDKMLRLFGKYAPLKQAQTNTAGEDVAVHIIQLPDNNRSVIPTTGIEGEK